MGVVQPLGDPAMHFWLTRSVARAMGLSLSEAMAVQQQEILVLRRQLELLKQRQDEQSARYAPGDEPAPALEKPPHY